MKILIANSIDFVILFLVIIIFKSLEAGSILIIDTQGNTSTYQMNELKNIIIQIVLVLSIVAYYTVLVNKYNATFGYLLAKIDINFSENNIQKGKQILLRGLLPICILLQFAFWGIYKNWIWNICIIYVIVDIAYFNSNKQKSIPDLLAGTTVA